MQYGINALAPHCPYQTLWTCFLRPIHQGWPMGRGGGLHATFVGPFLIPTCRLSHLIGYHNLLAPTLFCCCYLFCICGKYIVLFCYSIFKTLHPCRDWGAGVLCLLKAVTIANPALLRAHAPTWGWGGGWQCRGSLFILMFLIL
jgi:hypothetical protein